MTALCINCVHYRPRRARLGAVCAINQIAIDLNRMLGGPCGPRGDSWTRAPLGHRVPRPRSRRATHQEERT
jgi:hypothetical protein